MRLIFEAIKSLLRGVDSAIARTAAMLGKHIDEVQSAADVAKKIAARAQAAADEAQAAADNAQATAEVHPDWNESDPSSPAYVENRTHYIEHYMREQTSVEYGPIAKDGRVYLGTSNPGLAQALEKGLENITVKYRFAPDAPWEAARGSVHTISATDVCYYFRDQSGTYIFQYHKGNKMFANNFVNGSKDNLYIRVATTVPDVRYIPLRREFLPPDLLESGEYVRYTPQTLTTEQKALARSNIGAAEPYLTVTVSQSGNNYYTDKSFNEIFEAHQAGRNVVAVLDSQILDFDRITHNTVWFNRFIPSTGRLLTLIIEVAGKVRAISELVAVSGINGMRGDVVLDGLNTGLLPAPTSGTVAAGKYIRISSVSPSGQVYSTEAVDAPSGGGGGEEWRIIKTIKLTENVQSIIIDTDNEGNSFSLKKFIIWGWTQGTASGGQLRINAAVRTDSANSYFGSWIANFRGLDTTKRYWRFACSRGPVVGDHAKWYSEVSAADSGVTMQASSVNNYYVTPEDDNGNDILTATFINILSNTSTVQFTAGSEIELWGVDA